MNIKNTLKKGLEGILVTSPLWGFLGVVALDIALGTRPTAEVQLNNKHYFVYACEDRTIVRTGAFNNINMIDIGNDGVLDIYQDTFGSPRRPPVTLTYKGKDIPVEIQTEYTTVINSQNEQR